MSLDRQEPTAGGRLSQLLDSPVFGMTPWIAMSVIVGPGRYEWAVGISLAVAVAIVIIGHLRHRGTSFKILEISDVVFFAVMVIIGIFASPGAHRWLETYAGEISNIALLVIALGSMAVRQPFTCSTPVSRCPARSGTSPHSSGPITASPVCGVPRSVSRQ
ncbi:hypothetical protein ACTPOK_36535 [Streptomyces inhibens]|uniref:hypothetical protein n=1 Tax=Streptomyces inhibens TaxID=2293571 RepID=UPI00402A6355